MHTASLLLSEVCSRFEPVSAGASYHLNNALFKEQEHAAPLTVELLSAASE